MYQMEVHPDEMFLHKSRLHLEIGEKKMVCDSKTPLIGPFSAKYDLLHVLSVR